MKRENVDLVRYQKSDNGQSASCVSALMDMIVLIVLLDCDKRIHCIQVIPFWMSKKSVWKGLEGGNVVLGEKFKLRIGVIQQTQTILFLTKLNGKKKLSEENKLERLQGPPNLKKGKV